MNKKEESVGLSMLYNYYSENVEEKEDRISEILNNYFDKYVGMVFTLKGDNYL